MEYIRLIYYRQCGVDCRLEWILINGGASYWILNYHFPNIIPTITGNGSPNLKNIIQPFPRPSHVFLSFTALVNKAFYCGFSKATRKYLITISSLLVIHNHVYIIFNVLSKFSKFCSSMFINLQYNIIKTFNSFASAEIRCTKRQSLELPSHLDF